MCDSVSTHMLCRSWKCYRFSAGGRGGGEESSVQVLVRSSIRSHMRSTLHKGL